MEYLPDPPFVAKSAAKQQHTQQQANKESAVPAIAIPVKTLPANSIEALPFDAPSTQNTIPKIRIAELDTVLIAVAIACPAVAPPS